MPTSSESPELSDGPTLVELDNRSRISISRWAGGRRYYHLEVDGDGVITLTPAVVVGQAVLLNNPALAEQLERAITDPSSLVRRGRPTRKPIPDDEDQTDTGTVRTRADADLLRDLGGPGTRPNTPRERQNWLYALIETNGGAMTFSDIAAKSHDAGYDFSRPQISEDLTQLMARGLIQNGPERGFYELVRPHAAWKERIYEILVEAKTPMQTPDIWAALRQSRIGTPKRLDVATLLTELLMEQRVNELDPGTFLALPPNSSKQA